MNTQNKWIAIAGLLGFLAWVTSQALLSAVYVPTFHLDGAFQTASGLFRLDAGQVPGRDFFPYLGLGPLYVLYPFFKVFGSDLAASVAAAHWLTLFCSWINISLLWFFISGSVSYLRAHVVSALAICFILSTGILNIPAFKAIPWFMASPGNSLRPIRYFLPYFALLIFYFVLSRIKSWPKRCFGTGLLVGLFLIWSNDMALPVAAGVSLIFAIQLLVERQLSFKNSFIFFTSLLGSAGLSWVVLTQGYIVPLIKFNFLDIARDQWWYFSPYVFELRIFSIFEIYKMFDKFSALSYLSLFIFGILYWKTKQVRWLYVLWLGCILWLSAALASIGGHVGRYTLGFEAWGFFCLLFLILIYFANTIKDFLSYTPERNENFKNRFFVLTCFVLVLAGVYSTVGYRLEVSKAKANNRVFYVPELGGYIENEWKSYIQLARDHHGNNVFEEYWGIWSSTKKSFSAWSVDSIIHALGSQRQKATEQIANAELIISTASVFSKDWLTWNISQNFWFYEELFLRWSPDIFSPNTIIWKKNSIPRMMSEVPCRFEDEKKVVYVSAGQVGLYKVEFDYDFSSTGRRLLFIKNYISIGVDANGFVSLDPDVKRSVFPVYADKTGELPLEVMTLGSGYATLEKASCKAFYIPFKDDRVIDRTR